MLIDVSDGDRIALHDDQPIEWLASDPVVLLLHGLAGCHGSAYVMRLADRLTRKGIRVFRMDMRGTGAATGKARLPGHAGRTSDAAAAIRTIHELCPDAPLTMVGFSMGGNITLGTLADASRESIGNLQRGIAVGPPVDLSRCCHELRTGLRRFYDSFLVKHLLQRWAATGGSLNGHRPRSIYEFDDTITAPLSGFRDAEDYYAQSSSGPRLRDINIPTRIIAAKDDPVVAFGAIAEAERSDAVELHVSESGGHLGFFGTDACSQGIQDYRWMDWRIESWILDW